ncbi:MAG: RNA polymerase sigma factor region1.1 domain-containing protein, partial [Pirellulales bacterium]|nr:RNA polymerase sigma factor region1.1 domain-containing protein [Pirellulales bacterium]
MKQLDRELNELIELGKCQGFLTHDQVISYLPDEEMGSEKVDLLISAIDDHKINLVAKANGNAAQTAADNNETEAVDSEPTLQLAPPEPIRGNSDPIRMYLTQMAEIPLLDREEEIALAKKIEITRRSFRRALLSSGYALNQTIETLDQVHRGILPFDRTIKVSLTERLTKEEVQARMPHNLPTLKHLASNSRKYFTKLISLRTHRSEWTESRTRFLRNRNKCIALVEELSLRSRRIHPLISHLEQCSQRMNKLRSLIQQNRNSPVLSPQTTKYREELYNLMMETQESPRSLAQRVEKVRRLYNDFE